MKNTWIPLTGMVLLALSACTANSGRPPQDQASTSPHSAALPVFVRNSERSPDELQALVQGKLQIDKDGCLRIGENGPFIIWHHDSRIERTNDGRIRITDGFRGSSAYVGDDIAMGGGIQNRVPPATGERPATPTNVTEPIPAACASGEIWWAGHFMTEAERQQVQSR